MNRANRPRMSRISGSSLASKLMTRAGNGSTLSLDFTTGVLDPRITFSRASGGTYLGSDGYIYGVDAATSSSLAIGTGSKSVTLTATAGVDRRFQVGQTAYFSNGANSMSGLITAYNPSTQIITINATSTSGSGSFTSWFVGNASARFNYDSTTQTFRGLLIEGSTVNYALLSNAINGSGWTVGGTATVTPGAGAVAPDGFFNSTKFVFPPVIGGSVSRVFRQTSYPAASYPYTMSVWMKSNTAINYIISILGSGNTINTVTPEWKRFEVTVTSGASLYGYFYISNESTTVTTDISMWGAQFEAGNAASSYMPADTSTSSRAVDTAIIAAGANFDSWYTGGTTGTFVANWYANAASSTARTVIATNDETNKHLHLYQTPSALTLRLADRNAVATVTTANSMTAGALTKGAFNYASTDTNLCLNGGTVASGTLAFSSAPTWLSIGGPSTNGTSITDATVMLNNSIRSIKYWPTVLPNTTLQSLTT